MPDLLEHMYCAQQINIPPNLPYILKQYAKAAIRTQPYDLLFWSAAYFRAKANNLPPPVKERLEYPPFDSPSRLSPGFLRVLHKQLGQQEYVREEILYEKWMGVCLEKEALDLMLKIGNIQSRVPWLKFVAIAAGHICLSLGKTMVLVCEVLTDQPDGGAAWIPVEKFVDLYEYLARLNCGPEPTKKVELIDRDSVTSTRDDSSRVAGEGEEELDSKEEAKEVGEKDSTTGLMVWPDIKPEQKTDRVRTPKYEDEPGASSEFGVEVLDNAKGPVTELVTLYPVTTKSEASQASESPSKLRTKTKKTGSVDESILSHSSLKDNEEWIKIDSKDLGDEGLKASLTLDLDQLIASTPSKTGAASIAKSASKTMSNKERNEEAIEDHNNPIEKHEEQEGIEDKGSQQNESQTEDDVLSQTTGEEETQSKVNEEEKSYVGENEENNLGGEVPDRVRFSPHGETEESGDFVEKNTGLDTEGSNYTLDKSITMENFVKSREVGYSVVEIRKGRFGDKSIDRLSDEGPIAAATVHQLLSVESEESFDTQEKEPELPFWNDVPGIGPVIPESQILAVVEYMQYWASKQEGMVGPRNINHLLCPPLDLPPPPPLNDTPIIYSGQPEI